MITSQEEYEGALRRIREDEEVAQRQRQSFSRDGLLGDELERAMQPLVSFHAQLIDEVRWYQDIRAGNFSALRDLTAIGTLLVAIRIQRGMTQADLAKARKVSVEEAIRDERDEYYGFIIEELEPIAEALDVYIETSVVARPEHERELVHAD